MDQHVNNLIGWQAYVVCLVLENTDIVLLDGAVLYTEIRIASRQIASTATVATAKKETGATAKITRILCRAASKATWTPSEGCSVWHLS